MKRVEQLEKENKWLKQEIKRLRLELSKEKKEEWAHPDSCVHNSDPWETWHTL